MSNIQNRRSGLKIMTQLIVLVKPLILVMIAAIILGTLGYLCAIFISIIAVNVVLAILNTQGYTFAFTPFLNVKTLMIIMVIIAIARGFLHYIEQYCNHFIAFKLLAIIRHKVFVALRRLSPAKLEGQDKGNLVSLITTDIELLEVFYAHTISPIMIAILTCIVMICYIGHYSIHAAVLALVAYIIVGAIVPLWNGRKGANNGLNFRNEFGDLNSFVLDSLRGLDETIQYNQGAERLKEMEDKSDHLATLQKYLNRSEGNQKVLTNLAVLMSGTLMLVMMICLYLRGSVGFESVLICTVALISSFGPVIALANLSNNLNQTLASGERVLSLLEEEPMVKEIPGSKNINEFEGAKVANVSFKYDDEMILKDYSLEISKGQIIGIHGASGSGKSTLLKLLMRFFGVQDGSIKINDTDLREFPTSDLRNLESYVTQETHLFADTIANNIRIGKLDATQSEIEEAAKKASIHDFIVSLPNGYETQIGELGDTLSGGEKQRIGIARAFLHDAPLILMDEPTSNLDALNEGIILKSLKEASDKKTVVLVSHRNSTMNIADQVYEMDNGRLS